MPNAFVRVAPDSTVTVIIKHLDKGQGVTTGLTTIVAEELDADWAQMRFAFAPANAALYNNLYFGPVQGTGGSTSVANSWLQLRRAGAAARAMLVAAAADAWGVPAAQISIEKGVLAAGEHRGTFGDFAAKAATLPVPTDVTLKDPKDFRLIGTRVPRLDSVAKTTGAAIYSLDIRRPGMKTAVLMHPPRFGATVKILRRRRREAGARRHRRGGDPAGRRGRRRRHPCRDQGPRGAARRMGRHACRDTILRRDLCRVPQARRRPRRGRGRDRRCRARARRRGEGDRGGLRVSRSSPTRRWSR